MVVSGWIGSAGRARSVTKNHRNTRNSTARLTSHGVTISAVKPRKDRPETPKASRLVRLETGNSVDAEFARWVHAYTCGLGRRRSRAAVPNTTGVSRMTVASRL